MERHQRTLHAAIDACVLAVETAQLRRELLADASDNSHARVLVAKASVDERRRIERDLHDDVQQRLLALQIRLRMASGNTDETTQEMLETLNSEIGSALAAIRDIAHGESPPELRQFGLGVAIEAAMDTLPLATACAVDVDGVDAVYEEAAFFIVKEAISNVVKHADATRCSVDVRAVGGRLFVRIDDDGRGVSGSDGFGIRGMRSRAEELGGWLRVAGSTSGTTVEAEIPLGS